jgi:hypothetical protein
MVHKMRSVVSYLDSFCLQEAKITSILLIATKPFTWSVPSTFVSNHEEARGSVALLVGPTLPSIGIASRTNLSKRLIWVLLNLNGYILG